MPDGSTQVLKSVPVDDISPDAGNQIHPDVVRSYQTNGYAVHPELRDNPEGGFTVQEGHHRISADVNNGAKGILAWTPEAPAASAAAPGAPPAAVTPYDQTAATIGDKYKANAAAADEVKAQWMFEHNITKLTPGQPFKDLVDQIPNPNAKPTAAAIKRGETTGKFTTRLNDPDHASRVQTVQDLLDQKHATAAATARAGELDKSGMAFADASKMTPEQLGVKTPLDAANTLFQLKKLQLAPSPAQALAK